MPRSKYAGTPRACERVFEQAEVLVRRAKTHRHLIERNAGRGFVKRASRDLERFARFTWRRKQTNVTGGLRLGRRIEHEDAAPQPSQIGLHGRIVAEVDESQTQRFERMTRQLVTCRATDKRIARSGKDRSREATLGDRVEWNVEHHHRTAAPADCARPRGRRRDEQGGAVVHPGRIEATLERLKQVTDVGCAGACAVQRARRRGGQPQFVNRARERLWGIPASTPRVRSTPGPRPSPRRTRRAPRRPRGRCRSRRCGLRLSRQSPPRGRPVRQG
jgi:hypothetical protein